MLPEPTLKKGHTHQHSIPLVRSCIPHSFPPARPGIQRALTSRRRRSRLPRALFNGGKNGRLCLVCCKPTISPRFRYCARCYKFTRVRKEIRARVRAMKAAYDPAMDRFICHYSGAPLNTDDNKDPFFLCFDHAIPRKRNDLVVCASLFNYMKSDMTDTEFPVAVHLIANFIRTGVPFDKNAVKFEYWHRVAKKERLVPAPPITRLIATNCRICGKPPVIGTLYCARCHKLADACDFSEAKMLALRARYDPETDTFRCEYCGAELDIENPDSPYYLSWDHVVPKDGRLLVPAAFFVNVMKSELTADEFRAVILELDRHFETGEPFDTHIVKFEYWTGLSKKLRRGTGEPANRGGEPKNR